MGDSQGVKNPKVDKQNETNAMSGCRVHGPLSLEESRNVHDDVTNGDCFHKHLFSARRTFDSVSINSAFY